MAGNEPERHWGRALRYGLGVAACLLAVVNVLIGSPWYVTLIVAIAGVGIIYGSGRRTFRAGVRRAGEQIVCRYIPWYEGNAYVFGVLVPLMGVAGVAAGVGPDHPPTWLLFGGVVLLCISALMVVVTIVIWRRSLLCISPAALTVRLPERGADLIEIRRESIQSIGTRLISNTAAGTRSAQVEVVYRPVDAVDDMTKTVLLGMYLSVRQTDLLEALLAWKDDVGSANELLDQVEGILRGRRTAQA